MPRSTAAANANRYRLCLILMVFAVPIVGLLLSALGR